MSYGNKPNEIKHSSVSLLAEEYPVQRVQSLGYSADLNSEEVYQLTDSEVVEVVDSDPSVSLTIDVNDFGSTNFWNELGGYHKNRDNDWTNTNSASGVVTLANIEDYPLDFIVQIAEGSGSSTITRSTWFNNCFLDSVSGTYQVDGFATESFSFSGNRQKWFLNGIADVNVSTPVYATSTTLDYTSDGTILVLTEDGVELPTTTWSESLGTITASGITFDSGKRYRAVAFSASPDDLTTPESYTSNIGGVKEGELELIMWNADEVTVEPAVGIDGTAYQKILRVQSVDYEVSFDREDLKQLYTGAYYKGLNSSNITATISVLDSDLELWAMTTSNTGDWSSDSVYTMSLTDFQSSSNMSLRVDVFGNKDYAQHTSSTHLKSIKLTGGKVTSVADSFDVPGRGSQTFELTFTGFEVQGTGQTGRV